MTEPEWLVCTDPRAILTFIGDRLSQRQLHRLVLECCRVLQPICGNDKTRRMLQVAEPFNERNEMNVEVVQVRHETRNAVFITENDDANCAFQYLLIDDLTPGMVEFAVRGTLNAISSELPKFHPGEVLRCIFGNPFRPVTFDPAWRSETTVVALATGVYAERAFDRLPILADALEEAGCDHPDVLSHCRGPGPHARGCWVVDLMLGKS